MTARLMAYHVPGGASTAKDLCGQQDIPSETNAAENGNTRFGPALVNTGSADQGASIGLTPSSRLAIQPPLTIMCAIMQNSTPDNRAPYYGVNHGNGVDPFWCYGLTLSAFPPWFEFSYNNGTTFQSAFWGSANMDTPGPRVFVGRLDSTGSSLWCNGAQVATSTGASSITYWPSNNRLNALGSSNASRASFNAGAIWNRALTDAEIIRLSADPFLFLKA
jgi:hypothetical protein